MRSWKILFGLLAYGVFPAQMALSQGAFGPSGDEGEPESHAPNPILRECVKIKRAEGRQASHPVFGETASPAHSTEVA